MGVCQKRCPQQAEPSLAWFSDLLPPLLHSLLSYTIDVRGKVCPAFLLFAFQLTFFIFIFYYSDYIFDLVNHAFSQLIFTAYFHSLFGAIRV
jgi:hypothetical protein